MKNVLIVEDSKIIRQGITAMVSRCGVPIGRIMECKNGLEALEIIREHSIDVLITDIRMPKMDGITLVKELQKYLSLPRIIVISGYDDFSFAVDLLRCGAREYLLKPVRREEIKAVMEKMEDEIRQEDVERKNKKTFCYGQLRAILSSDAMALLETGESENWTGLKNEAYQVICTNDTGGYPCFREKVFFFPNIEETHVILLPAGLTEKFVKDSLTGLCPGISESYLGLYNLRKAFLEARQRRERAFFMRKEEGRRGNGYQVSFHELESFVQRIGTLRNHENEQFLIETAGKVKQGDMEGERFQEMMRQIVSRVKDFYGRILEDEGINIDNLYHMLSFKNVDEYCREIQRIFSVINQKTICENDDYRNRIKVEQAIDYMKRNFAKDINMAMVSNHVSMNYTVFSIAFKEYTGEKFVNYLRDIRMEEAKRLLTETDQKIGQISLMSGYDNGKHFMKTFKYAVGVTPSEYRKNTRFRTADENITPKTKIGPFQL
ncbi:response regulator [Lachnospiraceae bacterium 54-53]